MTFRLVCVLPILLTVSPGGMGNYPCDHSMNTTVMITDDKLEKFCTAAFIRLGNDDSRPAFEVFRKALTGFLILKGESKIGKNILTIIDFTISSRFDRMWIIDLDSMKILHRNLVAHGHNSGDEFAGSFSNSLSSHKSSLGFYITGGIYNGIHGLSLILDGVEQGINDNARKREIVIHGADYVSQDFIRQYGRLGRSFGCPAIPQQDHEKIIKTLGGGSCLYIYYSDEKYLNSSELSVRGSALQGMYRLISESHAINTLPDSSSSSLH
jgi:hypothetical protein